MWHIYLTSLVLLPLYITDESIKLAYKPFVLPGKYEEQSEENFRSRVLNDLYIIS